MNKILNYFQETLVHYIKVLSSQMGYRKIPKTGVQLRKYTLIPYQLFNIFSIYCNTRPAQPLKPGLLHFFKIPSEL